jgi:hypothetical protein
MPRYRLMPLFSRTDRDDLTLEIDGDRARIYDDTRVYHDWGYVDCVDYVLPPGMFVGPQAWGGDPEEYPREVRNDFCFVIMFGWDLRQYEMSRAAEQALRRFWDRGYLLRNPNAERLALGEARVQFAVAGGIVFVVGLVTLLIFLLTGGRVAFLLTGLVIGAAKFIDAGFRLLKDRTAWRRVREELRAEGIDVPDPDTLTLHPPPKIDEVMGHLRLY